MEQSHIAEKKHWFAIATRSRNEKKVAERLQQHHWDCYLPLYTQINTWSDRLKKVDQPLVPSVVFVYCTEKELLLLVKDAGSTVKIIRYLGKPAVLQEQEIATLKLVCSQTKGYEVIAPLDLSKGALVQITKGPFANMNATYIKHLGSFKVIVLISATRTYLQLEIPVNAIKKISTTTDISVSV